MLITNSHGTTEIRDLGGFLKEVFVGDQVPHIPQGLSCFSTEKEGNAVKKNHKKNHCSRTPGLSPQLAARGL